MFEWSKHSQEVIDIPHNQNLLDFSNLRAQASESLMVEGVQKRSKQDPQSRKGFVPSSSVASLMLVILNHSLVIVFSVSLTSIPFTHVPSSKTCHMRVSLLC